MGGRLVASCDYHRGHQNGEPLPIYILFRQKNIILRLDFKAAHIYASNKVKLREEDSLFIPLFRLPKTPMYASDSYIYPKSLEKYQRM